MTKIFLVILVCFASAFSRIVNCFYHFDTCFINALYVWIQCLHLCFLLRKHEKDLRKDSIHIKRIPSEMQSSFDIHFVVFRAGKRLEIIRKLIEVEYKREVNLLHDLPPLSAHQFLYPAVPSLIFEKQRKQILQRRCFMEEKLYTSNLEATQNLNKYTLGQVSWCSYYEWDVLVTLL